MEPGVHVGNDALIEVLNSRVAGGAVKDAQMEAAIQQVLAENGALSRKVAELEQQLNPPAVPGDPRMEPGAVIELQPGEQPPFQ